MSVVGCTRAEHVAPSARPLPGGAVPRELFIRRQMTGDLEQQNTQWMWVTTLTQSEVSTERVVRLVTRAGILTTTASTNWLMRGMLTTSTSMTRAPWRVSLWWHS